MTKTVPGGRATVDDPEAALAATLTELEGSSIAEFRSLRGPADEARRLADELGDEPAAQRATLLLADVLMREGRIGAGGRAAHQVLAWAELHDSPYVLARAHRALSMFYRLIGDLSDALAHGVQCLAGLPEDAPPGIRARHLMTLGVALDDLGSMEESERHYREALAIAADTGEEGLALRVLNNLTYNAYENGDEPAARALADRMREIATRSDRPLAAKELDTLARVEMMGGRYDALETILAAVLDGRPGDTDADGDGTAECLLTLAEARRLAGRHREAQLALDRAVRECETNGLAGLRTRARQEQAALYAATGRYHEAYEEHQSFHADSTALHSTQREARAQALQAVFETDEARRSSERFRELAHRDALTGLYNRRHVNERLPALLAEAGHRPISIALVDLDHFKQINDTLSHATGDTVLQHVSRLLQEAADGPALAARLGGEEFLLIFPQTDAPEAAARCERLRLRIRAYAWAPITGTLPVTASIGVTTATDGRATASALLSQADRNLYAAKSAGRDRIATESRR